MRRHTRHRADARPGDPVVPAEELLRRETEEPDALAAVRPLDGSHGRVHGARDDAGPAPLVAEAPPEGPAGPAGAGRGAGATVAGGRREAGPAGRDGAGGGGAGTGSDREVEVMAEVIGVRKVYGTGPTAVAALDGVTAAFRAGEFTAVMGPSGSGKSTFLHCLAGLDTVTEGEVHIGGEPLAGRSDKELTALRRDRVGFVFQQFNLLPTLTAEENITLPLQLARRSPDPDWLLEVVAAVGLTDRLAHRPAELSGGQQQRVACARALITRPAVVFADEPTGNLDSRSSAEVLAFLRRMATDLGQTIVMVTHEPSAAAYADRVVFLADGRIVDELPDPTADAVLDRMKRLDRAGA